MEIELDKLKFREYIKNQLDVATSLLEITIDDVGGWFYLRFVPRSAIVKKLMEELNFPEHLVLNPNSVTTNNVITIDIDRFCQFLQSIRSISGKLQRLSQLHDKVLDRLIGEVIREESPNR